MPIISNSQMNDETNWELFVKNFYSKPDYVTNQPIIKLNYGFSNPSCAKSVFNQDFQNTYSLGLYYGFQRIDFKVSKNNIFKHQSEYTYLQNISTNFKTLPIKQNGIITDSWNFGFGLADGFGYELENKNKLYLIHDIGFAWNRVDFDLNDSSNFIRTFDENFKFGMTHNATIQYQVYQILNISISFEQQVVIQDFEIDKFLSVLIFDNFTQRWIDYFEPDLLEQLDFQYPIVKFLYKNALSYFVYYMRQNEGFYPFQGKESMNFNAFKLGINLIF